MNFLVIYLGINEFFFCVEEVNDFLIILKHLPILNIINDSMVMFDIYFIFLKIF